MDQLCDIYKNEETQEKLIRKVINNHTDNGIVIDFNKRYLLCNGEYHYILGINEKLRVVNYTEKSIQCPIYTQKLKETEQRRKKSNILRQKKEIKTFANFDPEYNNQQKELELIKAFPYNEKYRKLILIGKAGIGKTHLSLALKYFLEQEELRADLINVQVLYKIFRDMNFFEVEENAIDRLQKLKENHLLIIDDLGLEKQTEKGVFNYGFIELIDSFIGKIVITSNFSIEEMRGFYNDKIISRLLENSLILYLTGKDYREK